MRLLITTQTVNENDSNLGFFHTWIAKLAEQFEKIEIICLFEGVHDLPKNVTVHSLGKEKRRVSKLVNAIRFYILLFKLRGKYDFVFVHMNVEYAILGGLYWQLARKKVLLWYVHKAVNFRLWMSEKFVSKIFTASKESFRLKSNKVEVVGHGIPVDFFSRSSHSSFPVGQVNLLSVGRITKSKDLETVIRAAANILNSNLMVIGSPITKDDQEYKERLNKLSLELKQSLHIRSANYKELPELYNQAHILVHTSRTGSLDKVVLEALAAGRLVVTSSEAYANLASGELKNALFTFPPGNYQELAKTIENIRVSGILDTLPVKQAVFYVKVNHSLDTLVVKIKNYFSPA